MTGDGEGRSAVETVALGGVLALIILVTVLGNLLVCVTIATNRRLKSPTNFFILSLSCTDLLLGCLVLPFSAINTVYEPWLFGPVFCNVYTSCDVMLCTVSILTLFAISLDRYYAVQRPLDYLRTMSIHLVVRLNIAIWAFSLVMAFVPIHVGWNSPSGTVQNYEDPSACSFQLNVPYVLLVAVATYFVPLILMCAVYAQVLRETRRQVRQINRLARIGCTSATKSSKSGGDSSLTTPLVGGVKVTGSGGGSSPLVITNTIADVALTPIRQVNGHRVQTCLSNQFMQPPPAPRNNRCSISRTISEDNALHRSRDLELKQQQAAGALAAQQMRGQQKFLSDTKATATLASVVVCFAVCWVPYFALFTAKPFLASPVNKHLDLFVLWLGYANSAVNPFLYAFYNSNFRDGFYRVLCRRRYARDLAARHRLEFSERKKERNQQQNMEMPNIRP
jgi:hypothetical protein